jgi:hypothetical protein
LSRCTCSGRLLQSVIGRTGDNEPRFLRDLGRSSRCADPSAAAPIPKWQALLRPRHAPEGRRDGVSHRESNWNPTAPSARGPRITVSMSLIDLSQFLFGSGIRNRGARQIYSTASRDVGDHVIDVLRALESRKCNRGLGIVPLWIPQEGREIGFPDSSGIGQRRTEVHFGTP